MEIQHALFISAFEAINRVCIDSPSCHAMQLAGTSVMAVEVATVVPEPLQSANA